MTFISNDPSFWPLIAVLRYNSYYIVASSVVVVYDWVLTFGQEFDLILWRRWSFVTFLYVGVRYGGLLFCVVQTLLFCTSELVHLTDLGCTVLSNLLNWMIAITNAMLGIVMITRLYAMCQRSRITLVLLILIYSAVTITCIVIASIWSKTYQFEEFVLSGQYVCHLEDGSALLPVITWILCTVWEVPVLCLSAWIAIKHFCALPAGWTIEDCFTVLIRSHVLYFASFAAVACLNVSKMSPSINTNSMWAEAYAGILQTSMMVQMFVLGPRLILSVRQYNAKVVGESDEAIATTSISFQQPTQASNYNDV